MNVRIEMIGHGRGKIFIEDKEVEHCTGFTLKCGADEVNEVILSFRPNAVTYDGIADVTSIGDDSRKWAKVEQ